MPSCHSDRKIGGRGLVRICPMADWETCAARPQGCAPRHQEDEIVALRFPYRLAAAACLGLSSVAGAADAPKLFPSAAVAGQAVQTLADAIASKLAQAGSLHGYQVEVTCVAGNVELTGSVGDAKQKS